MRISNWLAAAAGAALLAGAGQAGAVTYVATLHGTIITGYDNTGIFEAPNADLTGQSFTAVLHVDTSLGAPTSDFYHSSVFAPRPGSIFTSTAITIGGVTHSLDSLSDPSWGGNTGEFRYNYADYYAAVDPSGPECAPPLNACTSELGFSYDATFHQFLFDSHGVNTGDIQRSTQLFNLTDTNLPTPGQPLTGRPLSVAPGDVFASDGTFRTYDMTLTFNPDQSENIVYAYDTYAHYHVDSIDIAGVPEPAAWALMILGFGMAGGALRRRRVASMHS
jgi:hypothetical protein